jgi:hypothetical protein
MSDVSTPSAPAPSAPSAPSAPAPSAPAPQSAPQSAPREAVINPNQPSQPNPVGPQAPPKPTGDLQQGKGRPESRREGIQRAIEEVRAKQPAPPREAKKGDNQPPEDTPDEKLDLKKRPSDQPRDRGRFAPRAAAPEGVVVAGKPAAPSVASGQQQAPVYTPPPPGSPPHHTPLARMSDRAKADWAKTPDSVRADGHRIYQEMTRALQAYKADHDEMNTIRHFSQMARQQGTTLARVLANHNGIEEKLRNDPIGAFDVITHNLNLRTPDGRQLTFTDLAWHHLNQTPEQHQLIQQRNAQSAQQMHMARQQAQIEGLVNELRRMQYAAATQMTRGAVDRYADTHPRFDELGDLIQQEIALGFDLDTAYRRADMLRPATAAQTRTETTAAQTRAPGRSISGAPGGGSVPTGHVRNGKAPSTREAITNAIRHVRGGL